MELLFNIVWQKDWWIIFMNKYNLGFKQWEAEYQKFIKNAQKKGK